MRTATAHTGAPDSKLEVGPVADGTGTHTLSEKKLMILTAHLTRNLY
jgi:hypothetical protein